MIFLTYSTAVIESIVNPVTKEYLLDYIANYGYRNDNDIMPPPRNVQQHHQQQQQHQQHHHHQQQQFRPPQ